jgi:hypothetical protein
MAPLFDKMKPAGDYGEYLESLKGLILYYSMDFIQIGGTGLYSAWGIMEKEKNAVYDYKTHPFRARITEAGARYIENIIATQRQIKVNESVLKTNKLTWANMAVTLVILIYSMSLQIKANNRESQAEAKEPRQLTADSLNRVEQLRIDSLLSIVVRHISDEHSPTEKTPGSGSKNAKSKKKTL